VSDIPVGSPPVPPGRHAAPSGWYADPIDPGQERYWDGWQWSRNTRAREGHPTPTAGPAGYPPNPGYPPQQGYPPNQAYPPQQGYPPQGYPQQWSGQSAVGPRGQAAVTADGVPLAGWWWRVLAALLDGMFTGIVSTLLSLPLLVPMFGRLSAYVAQAMEAAQQGRSEPAPSPNDLLPLGDQLLLALIAAAVTFLYQVLFLRWKSATPGKLICGLRVVPVDQGRAQGQLDWRTVIARALVWAAPRLYSLLWLVRLADVLFPLWHPKRQALHDLAARTQVTKP
jgi:uncharacterized RDD family membrane protein YckC